MTDNTGVIAGLLVARKLTAAEVVFSMDFVMKLIKKLHKDNPAYSAEQIANAVEYVFNQKLERSTKRLENIEKIRREYSILRSAQPVVQKTVDLMKHVGTLDYAEHAMPAPTPKVAKPAVKSNGAANGAAKPDPNQPAML
jgi:hypothetical protein